MAKRLHLCVSKNNFFTVFLYGLLLNLLAVSGLQAQVTIPAGNTAQNPSDVAVTRKPLSTVFGFERSAAIYLASEIGQTGNITAIGFFVESVNSPDPSTPVEIYLKQTTATEFTANTTVTDEQAGATLVFSGNITSAQLVPGTWITIPLTTPFNYTGNNLEVLVKTNEGGGGSGEPSNAKQFRYNFTGSLVFRFQFWQSDFNTPEASGFGGTRVDFRPNIQLTFGTTPQTCAAPTTVSGSGTGQNTATVNFSGGDAGTSYTIEYGPSSTFPSGTTTATATSSPASLTGLTPGTNYTFRVRTTCANGVTSTNSPTGTFATTAAPQTCAAPTTVSGSGTGQTTATVNFSGGDAGTSYTIEYGPSATFPTSGTATTTATSSPANLTGLAPGTQYSFRVRTLCANGVTSANSPTGTFTTTTAPQTCDAPTGLTATNVTSTSADLNFTASTTGAGGTYSIEYGPSGFAPGNGTVIANASSPRNVSNLSPSTTYQFYVTKNCGASGTATAGPASFTTPAAPVVCNAPTNLNATNITATSADLAFTPSAGTGSYIVEYGPSGFTPGTGTSVNVSTSPATVSTLSPNTAYQFYVTKNCGSGVFSNRVGPASFTTPSAPVVCNAPSNLSATNITNTSANLTFTPSTGAGTYNVEYGPAGFTPGTGTVVTVANSPVAVNNLTANTAYDFYVTKNCGGGVFSNRVGPANFSTTNVQPVVCDAPTNLNASNISATSASLNFTPSTTGGGGTYTLEYGPSGFAPGNGTVVTGLTGSPYNASNLIPGVTYDFYVRKDCGSGSLSPNAGPATFTTNVLPCTTGTWTGITSSDWHTATNWCNNTIPNSSTDVIIPALTLNSPVISANAATRNLTINSNATLTLTSGTLTVAGVYTNNGTFNSNGDGSMVFTGSSAQTIGKPGTTTIFRNLTTGGGPVNLGGPVSIKELLTLNSNLNTNGQTFTLLSAAGNQGMVVNNGGVVNGTATVQRFINPGINSGLGYRHFSSPVTNATISQLNDPGVNLVVNPAYNSNPTPGTTRPYPTIFRYNETRLTAANPAFTFGWESPNALSDPMPPGRGFTVNTIPTTVDISGTLNNGTVNVGTLTRGSTANSGWHLLGNPYPAPIDWDQVRPTLPAGVDDAVYVFRSSGQYTGSYSSYVNGVGGTKVIAVMQGFFVRANSTVSNFAFQNSARLTTYDNPAFYRQSYNETRPIVALSVEDNAGNGDQLHVYFQNGATAVFDSKYDAFKLPNSGNVASFYSVAGNDALSINGLPILNIPGMVIPLGAYVPQTGSYTIKADQILNFRASQDIYLEDRTTGTLHDLRQQASYAFTAAQTDLTGRFFLRFGTSKTTGITAADLATEILVYPNPNNGVFTISMPAFNQGETQATIFNAIGQQVWQQSLKAGGSQHIQETIRLDKLAAGVYTLRLETAAGPVTRKIVIE